MPIRKRKPTSPGRRFQTVSDFAEVTSDKPEKSLTSRSRSTGGRNALRAHDVASPRRRSQAAALPPRRLQARQGRRAGEGRRDRVRPEPQRAHRAAALPTTARSATSSPPPASTVGDLLQSGQGSEIRAGNALPLRYIPVGTTVHNVELKPGAGGKLGRGAGAAIQLVAKEGACSPRCACRPPRCAACRSTAARRSARSATAEAGLISIGKAGRNRWKGKRPHTRGVAMNPVDHPLGGGEGKSSGGRHPVSPWGKPEGRTRKKGKSSDQLIIRRRRTRGARR